MEMRQLLQRAQDAVGADGVGVVWAQAVGDAAGWQFTPGGGAIGRTGQMPWHLPPDLRWFQQLTTGSTVVMGRRTWESLPERFRPLPGRRNIVVSRSNCEFPGAVAVSSVTEALSAAEGGACWIIGGGEIYRAALEYADCVAVTQINLTVPDADTFAPRLGREWRRVGATAPEYTRDGVGYVFTVWQPGAAAEPATQP